MKPLRLPEGLRRPPRLAAAADDKAWQRAQHAARRWAIGGALAGALVAAVVYAPASWLARALFRLSDERAQFNVWAKKLPLPVGAVSYLQPADHPLYADI